MSTEADIVETVRLLRKDGMQSMWGANSLLCKAATIIEELAAERDAAARDMRERCATVCDQWIGAHQHFQPKIISAQTWATDAIEDIAEAIRALPDTPAIIATDREVQP